MIPRLFHFVFGLRPQRDPFHLIHYLCLESCIQVNRPERIYFHYHHEPHGPWWDRIRPKLVLRQVELEPLVRDFDYSDPTVRSYSYAHHADLIRLRVLIEHGGVYADMDTLFVQPLPDALYRQSCVIGAEGPIQRPDLGEVDSVCNALIMAEPGSEFCRRWLADLPAVFDGSWDRHSSAHAQLLRRSLPHAVHVEPARSFYKHMWTKEGIRELLLGLDTDLEGVYSFHLWSHLWFSPARTDFTTIHAGYFTEDFIRTVDTTYNVVARRFLPPRGL